MPNKNGLGRIATGSLNRDKQSASDKLNYVDTMSSSIFQSPYEFSTIFNAFTG